ncbi:unnamed protein product, partial [Rhizoctonia solani]
ALSRERLYVHFDGASSGVILRSTESEESIQKWIVTPVGGNKPNTYTIKPAGDSPLTLAYADEEPNKFLTVKEGTVVEWVVQSRSSGHLSFAVAGEDWVVNTDTQNKEKVTLGKPDPNDANQLWLFEKTDESTPSRQPSFQTEFFPLTAREAAKQEYDIIVVGSGIGGGVLVHDIYDTNFRIGRKNAKKVLLLERGSLTFHSHCLNTARPVDLVKDRGQHNDFFFHRFWGKFNIVECCKDCANKCLDKPPNECCKEPALKCCDICYNRTPNHWYGGPMYNLGGRSAAWGLFVPRIHDRTLQKYFPKIVGDELLTTYYTKAERLMNLSLPHTDKIHRHVIDRLNTDGLAAVPDSRVQWNWARIASEFQRENNFNFAQGAYSSIDKILEIALGKENEGVRNTPADDNVRIALNSEVRSLIFDWSKNPPVAIGVNVRTPEGDCVPIFLKQNGNVVLSAGSVDSPAILLRSGGDEWRGKIRNHRGLRLTDHDIYVRGFPFRYKRPADRDVYGPMKLQSYLNMNSDPKGPVGLANMSIDSSSFLPRGVAEDSKIPNFIMAFILERPLYDGNNIEIDPKTFEPRVTIRRGKAATPDELDILNRLTLSAMETIETALGAEFPQKPDPSNFNLYLAGLGVVAHELGTLPMEDPTVPREDASPDGVPQARACLDNNLKVVDGICEGVYVCDLSCFPFSPEVNPTLTLAALAIRLSRTLVVRTRAKPEPHRVTVVNHSGATVRIRLSNMAHPNVNENPIPPFNKVENEPGWVDAEAGDTLKWKRKDGVTEALFVRKRDQTSDGDQFVPQPIVIPAHPNSVTVIGDE